MLLAVDIGNTSTVFALYHGDDLAHVWRCKTVSDRSPDEYAIFLQSLLSIENLEWASIRDTIIGSVVPAADSHIERFCKKYLGHTPVWASRETVEIEVALDSPHEAGADRLVNAVAVVHHYETPAIVIDFGTATTFDVIDRNNRYIGGVIAPGIHLSLDALQKAAAKLPTVHIKKPENVIGRDTVSAMQSGLYWGYTSLIEGIVTRISAEMSVSPFIVATGGLASLFADDLSVIQAVDRDLTLKGLLQIYKTLKT